MDHGSLAELLLEYGIVPSANLRWPAEHMTLICKSCRTRIRISVKTNKHRSRRIARAIYYALNSDTQSNSTDLRMDTSANNIPSVLINFGSNNLSLFRATINSYLRLADVAYKCLKV